ncbi:MAG: helicase-related protein [Lachnospiraceae bacterium]|nr:helicase-related protein [Lachnospiraceae bacterium]
MSIMKNNLQSFERFKASRLRKIWNKYAKQVETDFLNRPDYKKGDLKNFKKTEAYTEKICAFRMKDKEYILLTENPEKAIQYYERELQAQKEREEKMRLAKEEAQRIYEENKAVYEQHMMNYDIMEHLGGSEEYIQKKIDIIENYLKTSRLTVKIREFYDFFSYCEEQELSAENAEEFIENLKDRDEIYFLIMKILDPDYSYCFSDIMVSDLLEADPKLKDFANNDSISDDIMEDIIDLVNNLDLDEIEEQILNHFSLGEIMRMIEQNPAYRNISFISFDSFEEVETRIKAMFLNEIPEDYINLYPLARERTRHFVIHVGPTNSGKTYEALHAFREARSGIYLAPLRLLACEVFESANELGIPCNLVTGEEESFTEGASHQASTIEMVDFVSDYDVAVIDECQMISDNSRGGSWTAAILGVCAKEIHLCTAPHALSLLLELISRCGDSVEVKEHERSAALHPEQTKFRFIKNVHEGDALIVFSKKSVLHCAAQLRKEGISCSVIYGALPYDVRKNEVRKFIHGESKVVVTTDAIGMGMNLPIRRIVFLEQSKFDGMSRRLLNEEEVQQIAGRAGRFGIFDIGYVNAEYDQNQIIKKLFATVPEIRKAVLKFPQNLINIDGSLSSILKKWSEMPETDPLFVKASITREYMLAMTLENLSDNKELIYRFVTIPFNEKDKKLYSEWKKIFEKEIDGNHACFLKPVYSCTDLTSMEYAYSYCDLYFAYVKRCHQDEIVLLEIAETKRKISLDIMDYLSNHELPMKTCKYCGRVLPWNYGYGMCSACHGRRYGNSYYDW